MWQQQRRMHERNMLWSWHFASGIGRLESRGWRIGRGSNDVRHVCVVPCVAGAVTFCGGRANEWSRENARRCFARNCVRIAFVRRCGAGLHEPHGGCSAGRNPCEPCALPGRGCCAWLMGLGVATGPLALPKLRNWRNCSGSCCTGDCPLRYRNGKFGPRKSNTAAARDNIAHGATEKAFFVRDGWHGVGGFCIT